MYYKTSELEKIELGFGNHQCNNGMHLAGLYETEQERDEIILGFFRQGLINRDINLYCPAEWTKEDFQKRFSEQFPNEKLYIENQDMMRFQTIEDLYYPHGEFSPWDMDEGLENFWLQSQENGRRAVRASADMVWAIKKNVDKTKLMAYESRLNYFIPGKPWVSICLYNLTKFSGAIILQVLQTHPYTISKGGIITKNPYFVDPDTWLAKEAPEYLNKNKQG